MVANLFRKKTTYATEYIVIKKINYCRVLLLTFHQIGVTHMVVFINKIDAADSEMAELVSSGMNFLSLFLMY